MSMLSRIAVAVVLGTFITFSTACPLRGPSFTITVYNNMAQHFVDQICLSQGSGDSAVFVTNDLLPGDADPGTIESARVALSRADSTNATSIGWVLNNAAGEEYDRGGILVSGFKENYEYRLNFTNSAGAYTVSITEVAG